MTGGSPAAKAGIKAGDTITAIDGSPVTNSDALGTLIKAHAAGDQVTVTWTDSNGSQHTRPRDARRRTARLMPPAD